MLHRLVPVLKTNIGWMFEESDGEEGIVFCAGTRPLIALDALRRGEGIPLEQIIPYSQGHLLQCNIHHIEKDGASAGPIQHAGEEVGYVLAGEVELVVGERQFQLAAGDSFVFNSDLPHHYRKIGTERASIFWVNTPPTFWRIEYSPGKRRIIDGPFAETKELVAGYTIIQVKTKDEAIEWANRFPNPHSEDGSIEIRQLFELEDFGESEAIDRFRDMGVAMGR
jgi:mannose-6-phosphate isomerase-like protein (cupin superfamily)